MTFHPHLLQRTTRAERYRSIRRWSEQLCAPLADEDMVVQPVIDVSPPKWHLGHTTWFFENFILREQVPGYELFDERLNWFFNSYYESQGPRILRSQRGNMTRPSTQRILAYRAHVDEHLLAWLASFGDSPLPEKLANFLEVGLQHEQQHQELLVTDIKYILGHNPLFPTYQPAVEWSESSSAVSALAWHTVEEGTYEVGFAGQGFCWDNELSRHRVYLQAYALAKRLVTNREYLDFVNDGGYAEFTHWQMEGIEWARTLEVKAPLYWYEQGGEWYHYTLSGLRLLDLDAPVAHLSFYEADAYARWAGYRLPTEQEWEVAASQLTPELPADANLVEDGYWHPQPVRHAEDHQLVGHTWEWTNSAYLPYPRYPRPEGALGEYNGKFMINQMVLRGGSCATSRTHIRLSYRNFFHPDKRWQFTGLRLARDV